MNVIEAIILGLVQGLTEFLPVSSSGHLTIVKELFGIDTNNLSFEVAVHAATVLSTIVVFRKEIVDLICGLFKFKYNEQTDYVLKIAVSMIPVMIVGFFFKDYVEDIFGSGLLVVGCMLLITSILLFVSEKISNKVASKSENEKTNTENEKTNTENEKTNGKITYGKAFVIGIGQALAVLPGLSRSGTTISTGLLLGIKKEDVAKFSFLMVLVPILGEAFLELVGGSFAGSVSGIGIFPLIAGFTAAFISGFIACKWMINIVKKSKLTYFSIYCLIVGSVIIITSLL